MHQGIALSPFLFVIVTDRIDNRKETC